MEAKNIIEKILDYKGMSAPTLASLLGVTAQAIYDILRGKTTKVSGRIRAAIARQLPEINQSWLVTGEGEMFNTANNILSTSINQSNITGNNTAHIGHTNENPLTDVVAKQQEQIQQLIDIITKLTDK